MDRKHHLSSSPGLAAKWIAVQKTVLVVNAQQKSEGAGEGGGGGVIMLKKVCGGGGRQIKNEKKEKNKRGTGALLWLFQRGDITAFSLRMEREVGG